MQTEEIWSIILVASFLPMVLFSFVLWIFFVFQKKKQAYELNQRDALLKEQALIIKNQENLQLERNRIATEMHDQLGSGLTVIRYLSDNVKASHDKEEINSSIDKIMTYSNDLITNMSEIIWSMNSRYDDIENLFGYIRRYLLQYLDDCNMDIDIVMPTDTSDIKVTAEKRRNIFLTVKEIMNNVVKYSQAKGVNVALSTPPIQPIIMIQEIGGVGFDLIEAESKGNGLYNIQKRIENIGGDLYIIRNNEGMRYEIHLHS